MLAIHGYCFSYAKVSKYSFNSSVVLAFALRISSVVSFSHKKEEGKNCLVMCISVFKLFISAWSVANFILR